MTVFEPNGGGDSRAHHVQTPNDASSRAEDRWVVALREIVNVLGPDTAGCCENKCEGCTAEMAEALRIAKEALGVR